MYTAHRDEVGPTAAIYALTSSPRGVAMRWFHRSKPKAICDEDIKGDGNLEAAHKIRDICNSAASSAERKSRPPTERKTKGK
jgi:hypothetical protein